MYKIRSILNFFYSFVLVLIFVKKKSDIKFFFKKTSLGGWGWSYSIAKVQIPLDKIYVSLNTEKGINLFHIEESPHYKCVACDHCKDYSSYIKQYFPELNPEKKVDDLLELRKAMKDGSVEIENPVVKYSVKGGEWRVIDGVHRLSVLKAKGDISTECIVV